MENYCNKKLYYIIKYDANIETFNYDKLSKLYFYILYRLKINNTSLFKSYLTYMKDLDNHQFMVTNKVFRKYVLELMSSFNLTVYDDKDIMEVKQDYIIEQKLLNHIIENSNIPYSLIIKDCYIESINNLKNTIKKSSDEVLLIYNTLEKVEISFNNISVNTKEVDIRIINTFTSKIDSYYRYINKFNKPELELYNYLIMLRGKYKEILYIFNHFTLPICRKKKHPLFADNLILLNINNKLVYAIIEFDGEQHYNKNYYLFNKIATICDVIKNNFCRANGINLLRLTSIDNNIIDSFIEDIINEKYIISCKPFSFYRNLAL